MRDAFEPTHAPFATGLIPAGFDVPFPGIDDDANGNRDSADTRGTVNGSFGMISGEEEK